MTPATSRRRVRPRRHPSFLRVDGGPAIGYFAHPGGPIGSATAPGGRVALPLLLAAGLLCACAGYQVAGYSPSAGTASAASEALRGATVRIGPFTAKGAAEDGLMCRASGRIHVEDGPGFADFLRRALILEVRSAGALSDQAPVTLTGTVSRFEFSTVMPMGAWTIELTLTSSNGSAVTVSEVYDFDVGRVGDDPCALTAAAAVPAVQQLITRILKHPKFADLLK